MPETANSIRRIRRSVLAGWALCVLSAYACLLWLVFHQHALISVLDPTIYRDPPRILRAQANLQSFVLVATTLLAFYIALALYMAIKPRSFAFSTNALRLAVAVGFCVSAITAMGELKLYCDDALAFVVQHPHNVTVEETEPAIQSHFWLSNVLGKACSVFAFAAGISLLLTDKVTGSKPSVPSAIAVTSCCAFSVCAWTVFVYFVVLSFGQEARIAQEVGHAFGRTSDYAAGLIRIAPLISLAFLSVMFAAIGEIALSLRAFNVKPVG